MRYQIVYMKRGFPLTTWANSADRAHQLAEQLRRVGYSVDDFTDDRVIDALFCNDCTED